MHKKEQRGREAAERRCQSLEAELARANKQQANNQDSNKQ